MEHQEFQIRWTPEERAHHLEQDDGSERNPSGNDDGNDEGLPASDAGRNSTFHCPLVEMAELWIRAPFRLYYQ